MECVRISNKYKCLLCLMENEELINIFNEERLGLDISSFIAKHFWFEIKAPMQICTKCWLYVKKFQDFYNRIYDIHHKNSFIFSTINDETKSESTIKEEMKDDHEINLLSVNDSNVTPDEKCKTDITEKDSNCVISDNECVNNCSNSSDEISEFDITDAQPTNKVNKIKKMRKIESKQILIEDQQIREYFKMECNLCGTLFDVFHNVKIHYRIHHKRNGYLICCKKKFFTKCRALEHIQRHLNPDVFKCEICNKTYVDKPYLLRHMNKHRPTAELREKPYKCSKCPKTYAKKVNLEQHEISHNTDKEKSFSCDACGKSYANLRYLQSHKRNVHDGANSHVCEICSKLFKSKRFFQRHYQSVHCNVAPVKVQCQLCGIWLKKDGLKIHMFRHEDEKKIHICNVCGKQSPNGRALTEHKKYAHLAERIHKCTICEKAFKKALSLKEHMTMHTGEILYSCALCPKTFNSSANMHAHRKKMHNREWEETRNNRNRK